MNKVIGVTIVSIFCTLGAVLAYRWFNPGQSATLIAVGDIASCASDGDETVSDMVAGLRGTLATLGDTVYEAGTVEQFAQCYAPAWDRHKARTRPVVGNHEYLTAGATPYFDYFGSAAGDPEHGYYSYDLGAWHIVALNSNCAKVGGCDEQSPQMQWLRADLAAHPSRCTLAYWHHPLYSSGNHGNTIEMQQIWQALYASGAELVLSGHDHIYERFGPQNAYSQADPFGMRQFVIGTGGKNHTALSIPRPNSEVANDDTFGVLRLLLQPDGYEWEFIAEPGKTFMDRGSAECHTAPTLTPTPTHVPTPPQNLLFSDDFEMGAMEAWTSVDGIVTVPAAGINSTTAARGASSGQPAFAQKHLAKPQTEIFYRLRFKLISQGQNSVYLLRFRDNKSAALVGVFISQAGKLGYRNDRTGKSTTSPITVRQESWYDLQVRVQSTRGGGQIAVWLNDKLISELNKAEQFEGRLIDTVQLGDRARDRSFDLLFDDIAIGTEYIH